MPREAKTLDIQKQVSDLVAQRGYQEGWTIEQFMARQVAKAAEELGEIALLITMPEQLQAMIAATGRIAGVQFDRTEAWLRDVTSDAPDRLAVEMADLQVVLLCMTEAFRRRYDEGFDVLQAALQKAARDVARGVRQ